MQEGVCWPPQLSEHSQGSRKAQNCKTEGYLASSFIISLAPLMRDPSMSGRPLCLSNLLSPRSWRTWCLFWAHMLSLLWHAMSFNSSSFVHEWVRSGSPSGSDLRYPNDLFIVAVCHVVYSRETEKRNLLFPSISTTIQRTVCFLHTQDTIISCIFWDEVTKLFTLLFPRRAPACLLLYLVYPFWCCACWNTPSSNLIVSFMNMEGWFDIQFLDSTAPVRHIWRFI